MLSQSRSLVYDVGAAEINGTGLVTTYPLDSNMVGAARPLQVLALVSLQFNAKQQGTAVELNWRSEKTPGIVKYELEKKLLNDQYTRINQQTSVAAAGIFIYSFTDQYPSGGENFYRLKITDASGRLTYSPVQKINFKLQDGVSIYPNPARDILYVSLKQADKNALFILRNSNGQQVKKAKLSVGINKIDLSGIAKGSFTVSVSGAGIDSVHQSILIQ